jgi:hypothetical protein
VGRVEGRIREKTGWGGECETAVEVYGKKDTEKGIPNLHNILNSNKHKLFIKILTFS